MHNIDLTTREYESSNEFEFEGEGEFEFEFEGEGEYEYEGEGEYESLELELTAELLGVQSEQELEQFLGKLVSKVAKGVSGFTKSPIGRGLMKGLKGIAKKALPIAGSALGSMIAPGIGTAIGGKLGSLASSMFEMELEGLSNEDREFEVARRYVKFATNAARNAANPVNLNQEPRIVINNALKRAALTHAPGLLRRRSGYGANSGTWVRRGRHIIIYGI